jgi:hypothetical protein
VASDGILRQEGREVLSPVQVRSMLESVARIHLGKFDQLAALETADGIAADDGRACDRVMGWARRLQASQGIAATVGESELRDRLLRTGERSFVLMVAGELPGDPEVATPISLADVFAWYQDCPQQIVRGLF